MSTTTADTASVDEALQLIAVAFYAFVDDDNEFFNACERRWNVLHDGQHFGSLLDLFEKAADSFGR